MLDRRWCGENGRDVDAWWSSLWLPILTFTALWCKNRTAVAPIFLHSSVVSFLLHDVTVFCKPVKASKATRQLLHHLAFNLHNFGLSEIELKLVVGLNFTVTRQSWVDYNSKLKQVGSSRFETSGNESSPMAASGDPVASLGSSITVRLWSVLVNYAAEWQSPYTGASVASVAGALITYTHHVARWWRLSITGKNRFRPTGSRL